MGGEGEGKGRGRGRGRGVRGEEETGGGDQATSLVLTD